MHEITAFHSSEIQTAQERTKNARLYARCSPLYICRWIQCLLTNVILIVLVFR